MKGFQLLCILLICGFLFYGCGSKEERFISACKQGEYDKVIKYLKEGISKDTQYDSVSCLMAAAYEGHIDIVKKLLDLRADPNLQNDAGSTALSLAVGKEHYDSAMLLVQYEANPDLQNEYGATALMLACNRNQEELVRHLLERGANLSLENNKGETALKQAQDRGYTAIVELLQQYENRRQKGKEQDGIAALPTPTPQLPSAEILKDESYETSGKAQVEYHVLVGEEHLSKETLTLLLQQFYEKATKVKGWKYHSAPTVIAIYMYTSKQHFESDLGNRIAQIVKIPSQSEPEYTFHEGQLRNIGKPQEEKWGISEEQRRYIYGLIGQAEMRAIEEADKAFPDFGEDHLDMVETLTKKYYEEIMQKYNLTEDQFSEIIPEGLEKNWPSFQWETE